MVQNQSNDGSLKDLWLGIGISIGIYALTFFLLIGLMGIFSIFLGIIAIIVLIVISFLKGKKRLGQGLLIGFAIVFLLTAACFGILIVTLGY